MSMLKKIGQFLTRESSDTLDEAGSDGPAKELHYTAQQPLTSNPPSLQEIVEAAKGSVRLRNCLKNSEFPFKTVAEYQAHKDPIEAVINVQNAGKRTAAELDTIIKSFVTDPEKYTFFRQANEPDIKSDILHEAWKIFDRYKFPDFIFALNISMRLENVLRGVNEDKENPLHTLTDCLLKKHKLESYFLS